jgi:tetratricopeptide (TPR) repeat protein
LAAKLGVKGSRTMPPAAAAHLHLGHMLWKAERFEEALIEETAAIEELERDPSFGPFHRATITARSSRAITLWHLRRLEEALEDFTMVVEARSRNPEIGADHTETLTARRQRADTLAVMGRLEQAREEYGSLIASYAANPDFGSAHPDSQSAREYYSAIVEHQLTEHTQRSDRATADGRLEDALDELTAACNLAARESDIGILHPRAVSARAHRAFTLYLLDRHDDALEQLTELVDQLVASDAYGADHEATIDARTRRADVLIALGRFDEALAECDWLVPTICGHPALGAEHEAAIRVRFGRTQALMELDQHHEVIREATRILKLLGDARRPWGDAHQPWQIKIRLEMHRWRAGALVMVHRYAEALSDVQWALDWCEGNPAYGAQHPRTRHMQKLYDDIATLVPHEMRGLIAAAAQAHAEGRYEHAVASWSALVEAISEHPSFGPDHGDAELARSNLRVATQALRDERRGADPPSAGALEFSAAIPPAPPTTRATELAESVRSLRAELETSPSPSAAQPPAQ